MTISKLQSYNNQVLDTDDCSVAWMVELIGRLTLLFMNLRRRIPVGIGAEHTFKAYKGVRRDGSLLEEWI